MLRTDDTAVVIIDVQGKLATLMHEREELYRNLRLLVRGARILELPVLWLEQYPEGLGPTIPEVAELLADQEPMAKLSFSHAISGMAKLTAERINVMSSAVYDTPSYCPAVIRTRI